MLNRLKNLFKSGAKDKAEIAQVRQEIRNAAPQESVTDPDVEEIIAFESLIEKALERYWNEKENGDTPKEMDPKIADFINNMSPMMKLMYFQNSKPNIQNVIKNIAEILSECNPETHDPSERAFEFFKYVLFRSNLMRPEEILSSVAAYSGNDDIPKETQIACTAEALGYIYITNQKIGEAAIGRIAANRQVRKICGQNAAIEDKYLNDPDYGLVPEKPIFVHGFGPHRNYLDRLCTSDGQDLSYKRNGSKKVKGIEGPVDIYTLFHPDGKEFMTIFQCVYGTKNSQTAPRGLKFKNQE